MNEGRYDDALWHYTEVIMETNSAGLQPVLILAILQALDDDDMMMLQALDHCPLDQAAELLVERSAVFAQLAQKDDAWADAKVTKRRVGK